MEKSRFPRGYKVYVPLVFLFALLVLVMPWNPKFNYDYQKGSPWMYEDLVSQFDFPLLKSEEQYKAELQRAGSSVVPVYRLAPSVQQLAARMLTEADMGAYAVAKPSLNNVLVNIYSKGVLPAGYDAESNSTGLIYVQRDMRASKVSDVEVYTI